MRFLEGILYTLFPTWHLNTTPWSNQWFEDEREALLSAVRIAYAVMAVGYPVHYFFVDSSLGLTVDPRWGYYRFGLCAVMLFSLGLTYVKPLTTSFFLRLNLFTVATLVCVLQSRSMIWYNQVPYFWGLFFAALFSLIFRFSIVPSVMICLVLLGVQVANFQEAGVALPLMGGAFATAMFVVMIFRARMQTEIRLFLQSKRIVEQQRKFAELQIEMSDQIQAFLPKKIRQRLQENIQIHKMTVVQAMDDVLRLRQVEIAAIYSDLRNFTLSSKQEGYLEEVAVPNIKWATDIIEDNEGIPRQIGDLILAYYDENSVAQNVVRCTLSAILIAKASASEVSEGAKLRRYVLVDTGMAQVGNMGGGESAREITALGTCINRLSRLDLLTKEEGLKPILGSTAVVLSAAAAEYLSSMASFDIRRVSLKELNFKVKDFSEENELCILELNPSNEELLRHLASGSNSARFREVA